MFRHAILLLVFLAAHITGVAQSLQPKEKRTKICLKTNKGTIVVALYNETPLHRDNFIKLTKKHFFDGTLFHRVIDNFMIQGGDPDSKNAKAGELLGNGGPGYEIPAEIKEGLIHKKGALAAARNGDNINPKRKSAGSQFYLVKGKVFSPQKLRNFEIKKNAKLRRGLIEKLKTENKKEIKRLLKLKHTKQDTLALPKFVKQLNTKIDSIVAKKGFHFTALQKEKYTSLGGVPHLDGAYTVFGEIVSGLSIVDSISKMKTDENDRPIQDVKIIRATIVK